MMTEYERFLSNSARNFLTKRKIYCNIITHNSLVKQETLDDYIIRKAEWYISAEEAINLKLAHEYYK